MGGAIGQALRGQGAKLALLYAPFEAAKKQGILQSTFGSQQPDGVETYECDITSEQSVNAAFAAIAEKSAAAESFPSILINTAGYVTVEPMEDTSVEQANKTFAINLLGAFMTSKAFYALYTSRATGAQKPPPGRIVSIASQAAHVALDGHGPYCASKAGLIGLSQCMAAEWGKKGITSNTVSPTVVLTELGRKAWADEKKRSAHLLQIPTRRFALPEEIAAAVESLCRDESGMINGTDIRVDGGFTTSRHLTP